MCAVSAAGWEVYTCKAIVRGYSGRRYVIDIHKSFFADQERGNKTKPKPALDSIHNGASRFSLLK